MAAHKVMTLIKVYNKVSLQMNFETQVLFGEVTGKSSVFVPGLEK